MSTGLDELKRRFSYHAPHGDQTQRYTRLRSEAMNLAVMIDALCPESREKNLAFTKIEEAVMWANASIARNEPLPVPAVPVGEEGGKEVTEQKPSVINHESAVGNDAA